MPEDKAESGIASRVATGAGRATSSTAQAIEGTQQQVSQGIMTGNAPVAHNPLNDALAAGTMAAASRFARRGHQGTEQPSDANRAAQAAGAGHRTVAEVPISMGGRGAPEPHAAPQPAANYEPPTDRERTREPEGGHERM